MGRKLKGWLRLRGDVFSVGLTLRSGRSYERKIERPTDGTPYNETYAQIVRANLVHAYETRAWDPEDGPARDLGLEDESVEEWVRDWARRQTYESAKQEQRLVERYVAPSPLALVPVKDLRPRHIIGFIDWLKLRPSARGGRLAPRTVRHAFDVVQRALDHAVVEERLASNPAKVVRGYLPPIADKEPAKRLGWSFSREEIKRLVTDPQIPEARRVIYAIALLTGARIGEIIALEVGDYEPAHEPLGRITIGRAKKSVTKVVGPTKTGAVKLVPVHPALGAVLRHWIDVGWASLVGRSPRPEDVLVPTRNNAMRDVNHHNEDLRQDCKRLGIRTRHQHAMRHTFISLVQDDGGDGSVLRWVTHAPPRTAFDGYTRVNWGRLCDEVAKLQMPLLA